MIEKAISIYPTDHFLWYKSAQIDNRLRDLSAALEDIIECLRIREVYELAMEVKGFLRIKSSSL